MKEFWLFLPSRFKEKAIALIIIVFLCLILIFLAGYFFGIGYGISVANAKCNSMLEGCIFLN